MYTRLRLAICVLLTMPCLLQAQAPPKIAYQGLLTDGGTPVEGPKDLTLRLFDAATGGTVVWTRAYTGVVVTGGIYNVVLEGGDAGDLGGVSFDQPLWLEVHLTAEGQTLLPRTPLTLVPYAQSLRNLRVAPETASTGPNMVGGWTGNSTTGGVVGATIAGGGAPGSPFGVPNRVTGNYGAVGGGSGNTAGGVQATVAGGSGNQTTGDHASVGGGSSNTAALAATVGGGTGNTASGSTAAIGGGNSNTANGPVTTVAGGSSNTAGPAQAATVGGGTSNQATGGFATVAGGFDNVASGDYSMIGGGRGNRAEATYSSAAGRQAKAEHEGSFVWADATNAEYFTTGPNQFIVRAGGGVGINTNVPRNDLSVGGNANISGSLGIGVVTAAEKLHVAGSVQANKLIYTSPRTHHASISMAGFQPLQHDGSTSYRRDPAPHLGVYFDAGGSSIFVAAVTLPHQATITSFKCLLYDSEFASDLQCDLLRHTDVTETPMASVQTNGTPANTSPTTTTIANPLVENDRYMYKVEVYNTSGAWSIFGSRMRLRGVMLTYTLAEAQ